MKDTNIVTKLTKLDISRIALCKSPADQDGNFVIVKSEDVDATEGLEVEPAVDEVEKTDEVEPVIEKEAETEMIERLRENFNNLTQPGMIFKTNKRLSSAQLEQVTKQLQEQIRLAKETGSPVILHDGMDVAFPGETTAEIEKSPVLANTQSDLGTASHTETTNDDGGKEAIQACIKELVESCNATKIVPRKMKKQVASIAKYHGVEGPADDDGAESGAFAEVTSELKTVVDILKGFAVSMAKFTVPASQSPAPAAAAKPAPAKKSTDEDDERIARLEKGFEKARFALLQAMGKDPTPPTE